MHFYSAFVKLRKATISFEVTVLPYGTTRLPLDGYSWNLIFDYFFEILLRKFKFHLNRTEITGTLHEGLCTYLIMSCSFILRTRNVSDKIVEKIKRRVLYSITVFENRAVYDIMWENLPQVTIWRVRIRMLDTEGYKQTLRIFNTSFPLQQRLFERSSVLRCMYISCLVKLRWCIRRGINLFFLTFIKKPFLCVLVQERCGSFPDHTSRARPFR
jgi:hypothetical protein